MNLPPEVRAVLEPHVGAVREAVGVGGGCIAQACRLETARGCFFLKWSTDEVAQTFPAEAEGLRALRAADSPLFVPEVVAVRDAAGGKPGVLLLAWIETGRPGPGFWDAFGRGLAALHRTVADRYGFGGDNFIGRLPQENGWEETWPAFFRHRRLAPQAERARRTGRWEAAWDRPFERLCARLPELLPERPSASVLHGDLWSGNFMVTSEGRAALVDPAAYYGHREADLAMTVLFGGFDARFYAAYDEAWPLEPGYDERRDLYNLYHLINHLNHFGGGYAGSVASVLRRYG